MRIDQRWIALAVCVGLAMLVWVVFARTITYPFINLDDPAYVLKNPHVTGGFTKDAVLWAFTHFHATNWHPVTWLSHMLDCQLYGLNPRGHHLSNVMLHMTTAILLFLVVLQMTANLWRSAFVAAVFAIHPLRVESVAWIAERKDVLSALFFVLTLASYSHYVRRPSFARYATVFFVFALGLMCKPMLVTLPLILLLVDYWPLGRFVPSAARGLILEKIPLLVLAIATCMITVVAQRLTSQRLMKAALPIRFGNAVISCKAYLHDMVWPSNLATFYPFDGTLVHLSTVIPAALLLSAISLVVFFLQTRRYLVVGWLWYLVTLGPVTGILQVGEQARADRYTYLPHIGLYLALTWAVSDLCARWRSAKLFLGIISTSILFALVLVAYTQVRYWKSSESLWRHTVDRTANNGVAHRYLGHALFVEGKRDEAIVEFEQSLQIDERQDMAHVNLGVTLLELGRTQEAISHFETALNINPKCSDAQSNLGMIFLELGRPDEALAYLEDALSIEPDFGTAHYNLANALGTLGRAKEALLHYQRATALDADDVASLNNMAWMLATWPDESVRDGRKAVEVASRANTISKGRDPRVTATLAAAYAEIGQFEAAIATAERATALALSERNDALAASVRAQRDTYSKRLPFRVERRSIVRSAVIE